MNRRLCDGRGSPWRTADDDAKMLFARRRRPSSGCGRSAAASSGTIASHRPRRRLDADHPAAGRQRVRRDRRSREQTAAAARHEQEIERADLVEELARRRALAGDDVRVIVGRDEREPALARQPLADRFAILAVAIVEDDLAAVPFRRAALHRRRVGRHDDDARDVEQLAGERDRLRVVAGRKGDDAAAALVGREARQRVVGAAELEGAGALQVLALEEQLGAGPRVDRARGGDRRAVGDAGNLAAALSTSAKVGRVALWVWSSCVGAMIAWVGAIGMVRGASVITSRSRFQRGRSP